MEVDTTLPASVLRATSDASSVLLIVGTLMGYLPAIAALVSIVYYCILIWRSRALQNMASRLRRVWFRLRGRSGAD